MFPDGDRGAQPRPSKFPNAYGDGMPDPGLVPVTAPATPEARAWEGWGTALKPAYEPIVVARKPLIGTVAQNVLTHGTGALNIDDCRIGYRDADDLAQTRSQNPGRDDVVTSGVYGADRPQQTINDAGRWPANAVFDEQAAAMLDEQTGELVSKWGTQQDASAPKTVNTFGQYAESQATKTNAFTGDRGGASRFFYVAKASTAERNAGLDGFDKRMPHDGASHVHADGRAWDIPGSHATPRANSHPTVKPVELMRWLIRLVTPPDGVVLDPFTGSGTTGCAAMLERVRFIGIERDEEYLPIARARIEWWSRHPDGIALTRRLDAERERKATQEAGQVSMFDLLTSDSEEAA